MSRRPTPKRSTDEAGRTTVHGKAANGEGSVYFTSDGRWRATYHVPGEARPRTVSAKTRDKAIARRDQAYAASAAAGPTAASFGRSTTVAQLAHWWLHNIHRHQVRPSTWAKADDRVRRITTTLGSTKIIDVRVEHVANWQARLLAEPLAPKTVAHHRQTLAQIFDQAIEVGLIAANPVRRVKPPKSVPSPARVLTVEETHRLLHATESDRLHAAVALLFLQGWRVSEALGLAWDDLDLDAATAQVRSACIYIDHVGTALAPPKTAGALGEHLLLPQVTAALRARHAAQAAERLAAGPDWQSRSYDGRPVELVFTTPTGGLVLRQAVTKTIRNAAIAAGLDPTGIGTHSGRRSVVTALYAQGGESLDEIARYVGHASPTTTAGYVKDLGNRPANFTKRVAALYTQRRPL